MDNKRQRERNPITGDGMRTQDSQVHIPHLRAHQPSPMQYGSDDYYGDTASVASEEEAVAGGPTRPETADSDSAPMETGTDDAPPPPTLQETGSVPATLTQPRVAQRQPRQRERNPITGDGMSDRDYRATVPSFKIHGPQRKENNPLGMDGYTKDDHAYRSHVQEASVSPLSRDEGEPEPFPPPQVQTPSRGQRQRDRNPITGYGMEERDFRVQIPTFKIHGPQRQSGDPLTGAGYATNDKEYQRQVQDASNSPLSSPPSRN